MKTRLACALASATMLFATMDDAEAQPKGFNYDEAKVPAYTLPDVLLRTDGLKVKDAQGWTDVRRPELVKLFEEHVYGRAPRRKPPGLKFEVTSTEKRALDGLATRKEVTVHFTEAADGPKMHLLLYLPNSEKQPVPAFLGLNFQGNHSIHPDPGITLSKSWMRPGGKGVKDDHATEESRGAAASRWPVEKILSYGYALATVYYGDIEPDHAEGWKTGVRAALSPAGAATEWQTDDWGAIGAWAWGLSRALDYLETDSQVDAKRVAVLGHSRLGKTSLWAGAKDERFAIVISNNSGCGGAALSRRQFGETVERINTSFPHWFCGEFKKYNGKEGSLPVDQHELIALMAPRPVYVASAEKDQWADPRGEFLSAKHAEPVYRLFGKAGLGVEDMPGIDQPVGSFIGYHIRTGEHDVKPFDWEQYLIFADWHLKGKKR